MSATHNNNNNSPPTPSSQNPTSQHQIFTTSHSSQVIQALEHLALRVNNLPADDSRQVALLTNPDLDRQFSASRSNLARLFRSASALPNPPIEQLPQEEAMVHIHAQGLELHLEKANAALDQAATFRNTPLTDAEAKADAKALGKYGNKSKPAIPSTYGNSLGINYKPQYEFRDQPLDNSDAPFVPPFVAFDFASMQSPEPSDDDATSSEMRNPEANNQSHSDATNNNQDNDDERKNGDESKKDGGQESTPKKKAKRHPRRAKVGTLHPFKKEILESVADNIAKVPFSADNVIVQKAMHETPFTYVDTEQELLAVSERFSKCTEIAIDLEHHNTRSFLGFTCLIQMSTRLEDVVIDVLKIRSGAVHRALAPIFADAAVTKVLHGADNDIEWLERDFGLYIVNIFDTGQAARVLNYPKYSLAYLLNLYCQVKVETKKSFQRADWRVRPIPDSMMEYARADTHYLLYIYDRMRIELYKKEGDEVRHVYEKSGGVALNRFRKPLYVAGGGRKFAMKKGLAFDKYQVAIMENLMKWRWDICRIEDESLQYFANDYALIPLARAKANARTPQGVTRTLRLHGGKARFLRKYTAQIAEVIANTLNSDVPELPKVDNNNTPKKKTPDQGESSTSSGSDAQAKARGGAKKNAKSNKSSSKSATPKQRPSHQSKNTKEKGGVGAKNNKKKTLNPSATVFTPTKVTKPNPSIRVRGKKASLLFDSDPSSASSQSHRSTTPDQGNGNNNSNATSPLINNESNFPSLDGTNKKKRQARSKRRNNNTKLGDDTNSSCSSSAVSSARDVVISTAVTPLSVIKRGAPGIESAKQGTAVIVTSEKKSSMYDLSDSDSNVEDMVNARTSDQLMEKANINNNHGADEAPGNSGRGTNKVTAVKEGIAKVDAGFSELWMNEKKISDSKSDSDATMTGVANEVEAEIISEDEIVTLRELRKPTMKKKIAQKEKKKSNEADTAKSEATPAVEPYDFLAEIEKDKEKAQQNKKNNNTGRENGNKNNKKGGAVFKALIDTQRNNNKTRRSKKNPASGSRTMTFSVAN